MTFLENLKNSQEFPLGISGTIPNGNSYSPCSTSSRHLLFISHYSCLATNTILVMYTVSAHIFQHVSPRLWNKLPSSLRQPYSSNSVFDLPVPNSCHIFLLCQHTTLTINNSLSLSLPAQNLPLSQIFPTTVSLPVSGLTSRTSGLFPLLIFPCSIKSRSSVLAPAQPGVRGKGP